LLRLAERELSEQGWLARIALAETVGAAWALAHFAPTPFLALPADSAALQKLPLAALRLPASTVRLLATLGVERIGQLQSLPRSSLPARFGDEVLRRLDQAFGHIAEPIEPHRYLPDVRAGCSFAYPVEHLRELQLIVDRLTEQLHERLEDRHQGARQVECWLFHETTSPQRIEVGLARPNQSGHYLAELLRVRLERTPLAAPVSGMSLRVIVAERSSHDQGEFFEDRQERQKALIGLIDRLSSRLGRDAVARAVLVPDPQPEYACRFESWITRSGPTTQRESRKAMIQVSEPLPTLGCLRPLRLQEPAPIVVVAVVPEGPPLRFTWAGVDYAVTRVWGPERIEAGWWRGQDVQRDYYVAATHLGNRFWLFRRPDGRWFLHGSFD
jgi:protein ImuB